MLDFFVLAGPTPAAVAAQYTELVGRPAMMPYWSLGFHQCKWGYESLADVEAVYDNYTAAAIPIDVMWCVSWVRRARRIGPAAGGRFHQTRTRPHR